MFEEHGWKKERFCRRFYKKKERKSFPHTWRQDRDKKKRQELDERLYLIDPLDWSKKKTIQWRFYVRINRSSNPNWSEVRTILPPVKYQGERKKISRFNQILSIPFFPPQSFLFVENLADVSRFSDTWNETWTMKIVIKEEVKVS